MDDFAEGKRGKMSVLHEEEDAKTRSLCQRCGKLGLVIVFQTRSLDDYSIRVLQTVSFYFFVPLLGLRINVFVLQEHVISVTLCTA